MNALILAKNVYSYSIVIVLITNYIYSVYMYIL